MGSRSSEAPEHAEGVGERKCTWIDCDEVPLQPGRDKVLTLGKQYCIVDNPACSYRSQLVRSRYRGKRTPRLQL